MNITTILLLVAGLVLLVFGADFLVRGASRIAVLIGVSPLVIGLTIVAYGTSSPEMAVSIQSSFAGKADIAIGNVIGSNLFNVLVILGLSSLISPLPVSRQLIRLDVPIMIGVSVLTLLLGSDGKIGRFEGIFLFIGGVIYTFFLIYQSRKQTQAAIAMDDDLDFDRSDLQGVKAWLSNAGLVIIGLILLVIGSQWLTDSSIAIARAFGISELVIGLTLVAAGTSLPELASSVVATYRGESDIAVGNIVGSNIFNILAVLALCAIVSPHGVNISPIALNFDLPFMVAVAIACFPIFFTGNRISRPEGLLFIGYYCAYTLYLFLKSSDPAQLPLYNQIMLTLVVPLTIITLIGASWRSMQQRRSPNQRS